ncbi:hypothetical protein FPQ18DRAFT_313515 [Pyronema domesticum]|nr:hypothetical protein FPQ18DRAFT_313515 [Pyronema domesticum]
MEVFIIGLLRVSSSAHGAKITRWGDFGGRRPNLMISVALRIKDSDVFGGLFGGNDLKFSDYSLIGSRWIVAREMKGLSCQANCCPDCFNHIRSATDKGRRSAGRVIRRERSSRIPLSLVAEV